MKNKKKQPMKSKFFFPTIIFITILLISSIILYAGAVVIDFRGAPGTNKVTLRWSTMSEVECKGFEIERGLNQTNFERVGFIKGSINSTSQKDYTFEDKSVFKSTINRTFYYRLNVIHTNDSKSLHSEVVSVTPSISGARQTWGSLKALFR